MTWEHADIAKQTADDLLRHFDLHGLSDPMTLTLSRAHWQLIVLALVRAARGEDR